MIRDENKEITIDVNHLVHFSFPKLIPFTIIKNIDTAVNINDIKYAIILVHHGNDISLLFSLLFLSL